MMSWSTPVNMDNNVLHDALSVSQIISRMCWILWASENWVTNSVFSLFRFFFLSLSHCFKNI